MENAMLLDDSSLNADVTFVCVHTPIDWVYEMSKRFREVNLIPSTMVYDYRLIL